MTCAPTATRTRDLPLRRRSLYPLSYRGLPEPQAYLGWSSPAACSRAPAGKRPGPGPIYGLGSSARPDYSECHAGQLPAHRRRGRASFRLAGRHRLT
jgi:hypothetical protein